MSVLLHFFKKKSIVVSHSMIMRQCRIRSEMHLEMVMRHY
uniref:Uncharacterized protein n=1 Tax=Arundo donax TaxID=35708 RepID=A0A0A9H9M7_ARUDO